MEKKKNFVRKNSLCMKIFKKRARILSKDAANTKLIFNRPDTNWIFTKLVNCIMKNGKKEFVEKKIVNFFIEKKTKKIIKNRPKRILLFILATLTVFRPVIIIKKDMYLTEKKKKAAQKRGLSRIRKKTQIGINLSTVKRQYCTALSWVSMEIKNQILKKEGKKKKLVVEKKIKHILNKIFVRKKKKNFFWKKSRTYSKAIARNVNKAKQRWK